MNPLKMTLNIIRLFRFWPIFHSVLHILVISSINGWQYLQLPDLLLGAGGVHMICIPAIPIVVAEIV
jgi:hypothetical protein